MAYSFPLARAALSDLLPINAVSWGAMRLDEMSGSGDGRFWQAELAPPLWQAEVTLDVRYHQEIKEIAATIRKLQGAKNSFDLEDPLSKYPYQDPDGSILGASAVVVSAISGDRQTLTLSGLPALYKLTKGDKGSLDYTNGAATRKYFFEVSETVTASGGGVVSFEVFPTVPLGAAVAAAVTLARPTCRGFIKPDSFKPGTAQNLFTSGASFTFLERR
jgi:hypothetical protein